jgi:hypothetical protein
MVILYMYCVYQICQHYGRHFICYKAYIMQSFTGMVQLTKLEYKYKIIVHGLAYEQASLLSHPTNWHHDTQQNDRITGFIATLSLNNIQH